ncbi:hypothetical protein ACVXG7_20990 [Enterobacter hormaechei]
MNGIIGFKDELCGGIKPTSDRLKFIVTFLNSVCLVLPDQAAACGR